MKRLLLPFTCLALSASACDGATSNESSQTVPPVDVEKDGGKGAAKADQWGPADAPTIFTPDLKLTVADLPLDGEAANIPWAASYWPVYEDTVNHRWDGANSESPAAKYGKAFNVADIENKISKAHGIDRYASRTACTETSQCNSKIGEACAKRTGQTKGYCIPTWWGLCHAWAPASILEAEPVHPVTRNGVTFKPNDIKALMTLVYNASTSKFVSLRCNEDDSQGQITYDAYGRPTADDANCKDTNAGTYHVLLTNYLGLRGQSFVEDRTFDDEVWNQPLRGYRITQQNEVNAQEANRLVGVTTTPGALTQANFEVKGLAKGAWHHQAAYAVIPRTTVRIEMTGSGDADLHAKVGAQPSEVSYDCRPYSEGSNEVCDVTIPPGQSQLFVSVHAYEGPADIKVSISIPQTDAGIPTTYVFNDKAVKFFHVKLEVDYITEAPSSMDGNLASVINTYTRTDKYEYILEVDKDGKVNGGEWLGTSKRNHPDFLWLPTGRSSASIAGGAVTYAHVKSLLDASIAGPMATAPTDGVLVEESADLAQNAWKHYGPYEVGGGMSVTMTGTGDADLYVKNGAQPTSAAYDCRPYGGDSNESCAPTGSGKFYVSVHAYRASNVKLVIRYTKPGAAAPVTPVPTTHLSVTGDVAQGAMASYSIPVVANKKIVIKTQAPKDVDLYVRMNLVPSVTTYDQRGYTNSGNETITIVPSANGILHIAVHGYVASTFSLTTADN